MACLPGRCYPVVVAEPRVLSDTEVSQGLASLAGWEVREGRLRKQYTFRTFLRAIAFANSVAYLAEGAGHHPDITINYNKVTLRMITHSEGALTDRDIALASDIDARLSSKLIIEPDA
jgi:4a-hydroxytetrahydrobiopterin dehydratase